MFLLNNCYIVHKLVD